MNRPHRHRLSRLHSHHVDDAAWRARQAQVDADIEGLSHDPEADRLIAEMETRGVPIEDQIERLKAHFVARRDRKPTVS